MKPILENWNKFLNEFWYSDVQFEGGGAEYALAIIPKKKIRIKICEQGTMMFGGEGMSENGYSEEESTFFKDLPQTAQQISNSFDKFLGDLNQQYKQSVGISEIQKNIPKFVRYVTEATNNKAKYVGHGKFRCVFDIGDEYVIKFDITPNNAAAEQNKTDAELGRLSHKYHNLFPLSAISQKDYRWVALEKVEPFQSFDMGKYNEFFPNSIVDNLKNAPIKNKLIQISFVYNSGDKIRALQIYKELWSKLSTMQVKELKKIPFKKMCNEFGQNNLYDKVINVIMKLGIRPEEIRLANTGTGADGRFVILDSSVDSQIISGFEKASSIKNIPSDTQKL